MDVESAFGRDVQDIENELSILKQKLIRMKDGSHNNLQPATDDPVLGQFAQILDKYEQKVF